MSHFQFLTDEPVVETNTSQFWSTNHTAGPTPWDVLKIWDRTPRALRPQGRPRPQAFMGFQEPLKATTAKEAAEIATFWRNHYNGEDWYMDASPQWLTTLFTNPTTLVLYVKDATNAKGILGTIVCRTLGSGFRLGSLELPTAFIIEGLCIHHAWRGRHLGGWLIAWVDHIINRGGAQAFFWSREAPPRNIAYVATHTYAHIDLAELGSASTSVSTSASTSVSTSGSAGSACVPVSWDAFRHTWTTYMPRWDTLTEAAFPTSLPADPLYCWRVGPVYIVVSDTRRKTFNGGQRGRRMWEVMFCADLYEPLVTPERAREMLEAVGAQLVAKDEAEGLAPGLLFATSASWQGGCKATWPRPWRFGTAGVHTTYIYNYLPPAFHRLATLFLRNEL